MASNASRPVLSCNTCRQPAVPGRPVAPCPRCNNVFYCSRYCHITDWAQHRNVCINSAQPVTQPVTQPGIQPTIQPTIQQTIQPSATSNANLVPQTLASTLPQTVPPPNRPALRVKITNPFRRLWLNKWLHDRPEQDVYTLLIDAYRLRINDDLFHKLQYNVDSLYCQEGDSGEGGFRHFLQRVENHPNGLLPRWWSSAKAEECVELGLSGDEWSSLDTPICKINILDFYKDWMMPMQLRVFADVVYTRASGMRGNCLKAALELEHEESL